MTRRARPPRSLWTGAALIVRELAAAGGALPLRELVRRLGEPANRRSLKNPDAPPSAVVHSALGNEARRAAGVARFVRQLDDMIALTPLGEQEAAAFTTGARARAVDRGGRRGRAPRTAAAALTPALLEAIGRPHWMSIVLRVVGRRMTVPELAGVLETLGVTPTRPHDSMLANVETILRLDQEQRTGRFVYSHGGLTSAKQQPRHRSARGNLPPLEELVELLRPRVEAALQYAPRNQGLALVNAGADPLPDSGTLPPSESRMSRSDAICDAVERALLGTRSAHLAGLLPQLRRELPEELAPISAEALRAVIEGRPDRLQVSADGRCRVVDRRHLRALQAGIAANASVQEAILATCRAMDPFAFEEFVVEVFLALGASNGRTTVQRGDHGVDGIIEYPEWQAALLGTRPRRLRLNVRRRTQMFTSKDVREFAGSLDVGGAGCVVSLGGFTADALAEIEFQYRKGYTITPVDGTRFSGMVLAAGLNLTRPMDVVVHEIDPVALEALRDRRPRAEARVDVRAEAS